MVWIGCLRCEKFRRDFIARTFALIAPFRPDLHRVSCSNEMVLNEPQTLRNTQEQEFRIQLYGSGAFVAKNSDATSLHELMH